MAVFLVVVYYTHLNLKCCSFYSGAGQIKWGFGVFDRMSNNKLNGDLGR